MDKDIYFVKMLSKQQFLIFKTHIIISVLKYKMWLKNVSKILIYKLVKGCT